jgi:lysine N6-hydroxylase
VENDLIGVGCGPTNLSLAALITLARERGLITLRSTFLEKNKAVLWHSKQLFSGTLMQTEFYRDLVTPIDPTSRFSFLNYLKAHGRLDQFFCSEYICPTRREFENYFNWVAKQISEVVFGMNVISVDYDPEASLFIIDAESEAGPHWRYESKHIVLGCGSPADPTIANSQGGRVVHVSTLLAFQFPTPLQSALVVGGGQSAAECVNYLLDQYANARLKITWLTDETAFRALDKGNFSREAYSASYGIAFARLPAPLREKTIQDEKAVAYGIAPEITKALYQRLYSLKHFPSSQLASPSVHMHPNTEVLEIRNNAKTALVTARVMGTDETIVEAYDCVILCTGFEDESVLESPIIGPQLKSRVQKNDERNGYAVAWDGPHDRMIFVQSQNQKTHGLGDANFVTAPGRNASILNSITRKEIYRIDHDDRLVAS